MQVEVYESILHYLDEYGDHIRDPESHTWVIGFYLYQKDKVWIAAHYRKHLQPVMDHSLTPVLARDVASYKKQLEPIPIDQITIKDGRQVFMKQDAVFGRYGWKKKPRVTMLATRKVGDMQGVRNIHVAFLDLERSMLNLVAESKILKSNPFRM